MLGAGNAEERDGAFNVALADKTPKRRSWFPTSGSGNANDGEEGKVNRHVQADGSPTKSLTSWTSTTRNSSTVQFSDSLFNLLGHLHLCIDMSGMTRKWEGVPTALQDVPTLGGTALG